MSSTVRDERIAAATAHWAPRFVANGTDYPDFQATLARITRWDDWCREWGKTAGAYERLAEQAEAGGRLVTAAGPEGRVTTSGPALLRAEFVRKGPDLPQSGGVQPFASYFLHAAVAVTEPV